VGGARKGFDAAAVDERGVVGGPEGRLMTPAAVVRWLEPFSPKVVAVDSPRGPAPDGQHTRHGERKLAKAVCGIRGTPDAATLATGDYYAWIRHGFALYDALVAAPAPWEIIEVFPTASWTRWAQPRGNRSRARWSREVLAGLPLEGLPANRTSQDARDAIAAALTARLYSEGKVEHFGDIVVPAQGSVAAG
jgi:predicted nuclease with RNAse H fold